MDPIEKAARAIADNIDGADADSCHYAARAVLEAIREPTPEMIEAGSLECNWPQDHFDNGREEQAADVWQAMINTILNQGE